MSLSFLRSHLVTLSIVALTVQPRLAGGQSATPSPDASYVSARSGPGRFPLSVTGKSAPLLVSAAEYSGVSRAAHDLRADIGRVTHVEPVLSVDAVPAHASRDVVIIGTLGK